MLVHSENSEQKWESSRNDVWPRLPPPDVFTPQGGLPVALKASRPVPLTPSQLLLSHRLGGGCQWCLDPGGDVHVER